MGCYKCPVCDGRGYVPNNFYNVTPNIENYNTNSTSMEICRSCKGTGIVWEPINNVPFVTGLSIAEDMKPKKVKAVVTTTFTNTFKCKYCDFHKNLKNCVDTIYCIEHKDYKQNDDFCANWRRTTATNNTNNQV